MKSLKTIQNIVSLPIKTALLAFVMILMADESLAQQRAYINGPSENQIDSLLLRFSTETSGRLRMGLARELGLFYTDVDPDTTMYFVNTQLQLAQSLGERLWEGDALRRLGYLTYLQGSYSESFSYNTQALTLFMDTSTERKVWEPDRLSLAGTPEQAWLTELALAYFHRAQLYTWISNISEQRPLYRKAIEIIEKAGDDALASFMYSNLAESYIEEYPDSAIMFISFGLEKSKKVGFMKYRGIDLSRLGRAHKSLNNFDSAEKYFLEAIAISREVNNLRHLAIAYYELARLNQLTGETTRALDNALNSYEVADSIQNLAVISDVTLMLSKLYDQLNDTDKAFYYLRLSQSASETLQKENQIRRASDLQFAEQLRLRDLEEAQARSQVRIRMTILMGVLFTIAVVAFLLFRNNRQKQKANINLQEQNEKVESTLEELKSTQVQLIQSEKMASLGELTAGIAHEIQNPLNFVNNFAEVSVELIEEMQDELAKGAVEEVKAISSDIRSNLEKINHHGKRADSIVKGMLEHSRTSSGERVSTDINALCDEFLRLSYHGLRAKDKSFNATFEKNFEADLPKVNGLPQDIARVLLNLINNAFYAVHEKANLVEVKTQDIASPPEPNYKPTVIVSTKNLGDQIEISVKDNGNGIPDHIINKIFQPFFTTKPTGQGTGLGLSLSYDIVKALGGELRVETKEGVGSEFIISLPIV